MTGFLDGLPLINKIFHTLSTISPIFKNRKAFPTEDYLYTMLRKICLYPFSLLFGLAVGLRNLCYDKGLLKSHRFELPVISLGNLSLGGTGKTPHIEYLIRLLQTEYKVAALSRGYGGKSKNYTLVETTSLAKEVGDEPLQIKTKFPEITVAIEPHRVQGIKRLLAEINPDVILLDDAFQHRKVNPGLSILLTAFGQPFYKDVLLPAGNLREPASSAERADIIIVTKCPDDFGGNEAFKISERLRLQPHQSLFFSGIKYGSPQAMLQQTPPISFSRETAVLLLSGIANSGLLKKYIREQFNLADSLDYRDHHVYNAADIQRIKQKFSIIAGTSKAIITTEKDAARLRNPELTELLKDLPVYFLPMEVKFFDDEGERFNQIIEKYVAGNKANH